MSCYFRVFKQFYTTSAKPIPKWLPESFIICPKDIAKSMESATPGARPLPRRVSKPDERKDLLDRSTVLNKTSKKPVVWIAKSSSGSKGKAISFLMNWDCDCLIFCFNFLAAFSDLLLVLHRHMDSYLNS